MKGIKTQEIHEDSPVENTRSEYTVKIDGKWFKITCIETPVLDGRFAHSSNVHKWDRIGTRFEFKLEPTEDPEQKLPSEVTQFISRYQVTGTTKEFHLIPNEGTTREYPDHKWGWVEKPFRHEYVV